ncbi:DMT family transporter [uncultured Clostridium sp.]|jgi:drug/metabolite transporter (DMT)-like permease|uniref:DMT family transporter n=1 Tax=uncultured Clostridium sp. TaxID=59620 RepID=UPI00261A7D0F|nr:DMT family transporter [uncultured Clostridium sp.]
MITKENMKKGLMFGILVGLAWGLDGVLLGKVQEVFTSSSFLSTYETLGISTKSVEYAPLVTGFFHESFAFFWIAIYLAFNKQLKHMFYLLFKTKKGKAIAIAALVGSPIGMGAYLLGIKYASAPYAASISVIYPGVGAILAYLILKEKLNKRAIVGIAVSLFGSIMLGLKPGDVPETFMLGVAFSLVAVLGWALEGVIVGFAMKHIKDEDHVQATPQQFLGLRYFIAMLSYGLFILPMIDGFGLAGYVISSGMVFKIALIATLGAITYLSWYKAVDLIGAAMGTALNSTAAFWSIVFTAILFGQFDPSVAIWCVVIVIGVFIFAIDPAMFKKDKKVEESTDEIVNN